MKIKLFQQIVTNVELLRQRWTVSKAAQAGLEPTSLKFVQPNSNLEVQVARLVINAVENVQDLDVCWIVSSPTLTWKSM